MYRDMKRLLLLFTLMGVLFVGCNKTEEEPCYLEIDRESVSISAEGGSVDVVIRTNRKWQITSDSDWCLPSITSGKACKDGVTITFSAELTYASREAKFVITAADKSVIVVVSQAQKDNMVLEGEESFTLSSDGGRVTLAALANVECEVIVPEEAKSWLEVVESRGMEQRDFVLEVAANPNYDMRSIVVRVVAVDNDELVLHYRIVQLQRDAIIPTVDKSHIVPFTDGVCVLGYQSNVECKVVIPQDAQSWITLTPKTRGLLDENVDLNISQNLTHESRQALIKIVSVENDALYIEFDIKQNPAPQSVDLGLSVKWANFNVGAVSPEDCGDYFAWGEIGTKSDYSLRTYLYWEDLNGNDYAYDMNDSNEWVVLGNDISGSELYDAATVNWGDGWRMPTESEVIELCEECVWKSDTVQGVHGVTVIGPNGNSIFLPAAGCYNGKALNNRDKYGHYWCSTPDDDAVYSVHYLYFGSDYYECSWDTRFYGHSVRPVVD